jgi:hypothetical protein
MIGSIRCAEHPCTNASWRRRGDVGRWNYWGNGIAPVGKQFAHNAGSAAITLLNNFTEQDCAITAALIPSLLKECPIRLQFAHNRWA